MVLAMPTKTKPTRNADLLRRIADRIENDRRSYDQTEWITLSAGQDRPRGGTSVVTALRRLADGAPLAEVTARRVLANYDAETVEAVS